MRSSFVWILIIAFSIGLSFWSLSQQSIRLDEAQSIWMSSKSLPEMWKLTAQDVNLPLYGTMLHVWMGWWGNDIEVVRILSLIFLIVSFGPIYNAFKESSNPDTARLGIALLAVSPFILWYSGEARTYTLLLLVVSANTLYFLRMIKSSYAQGKYGFLMTAILGWYTHYFFGLLLLCQAIYGLIKIRINGFRFFLSLWGLQLLASITLTPWLWYVFNQGLASDTQPLLAKPTAYNILQLYANFIVGFQDKASQSFFISLWPIVSIALFIVFTQRRQNKPVAASFWVLLTFLPPIAAFAVSLFKPIFLSRYLILSILGLFFWIAWFLTNTNFIIKKLTIGVLLSTMIVLAITQNLSDKATVKEDYKSVSEYLSQTATDRDIIVISAPFTIYPIEYNYKGTARLATVPNWSRFIGRLPEFDESNFIDQIEDYSQTYQNLYLVLSYDQGYEQIIKKYTDNNYLMLENKIFPVNINVRVYKLRYETESNVRSE